MTLRAEHRSSVRPLAQLVLALAVSLAVFAQCGGGPIAAPVTPTAAASATTVSNQIVACGLVIRYAADGAQMLVTLSSAGAQTQYNLQKQFAASSPPPDIGDRLAAGTPQTLRITGRQVAPDSGSPNAISLRDFTVTRVDSCS